MLSIYSEKIMNVQIRIALHHDEKSLTAEARLPDSTTVLGNFGISDTVINPNSQSRYAGQTIAQRTQDMFKRLADQGHVSLETLNSVFDGEVVQFELPLEAVHIDEESDSRDRAQPGATRQVLTWLGKYELVGHKATATKFRFG